MNLYQQWKDLIENQTDETIDEFWEEYSSAETRIYSDILDKGNPIIKGSFSDLATKYETDLVIFMGFLDGINTSLKNPLDIENYDLHTEVTLNIDFDKLYFNMLKANAESLYTLEQWDNILSEDQRNEILKQYKRSKTVIKEKKPGRNDPCPCGSGKKYKKCCGAH